MDIPDLGCSDEESFFGGLVSSVSHVPEHLKTARVVEGVPEIAIYDVDIA